MFACANEIKFTPLFAQMQNWQDDINSQCPHFHLPPIMLAHYLPSVKCQHMVHQLEWEENSSRAISHRVFLMTHVLRKGHSDSEVREVPVLKASIDRWMGKRYIETRQDYLCKVCRQQRITCFCTESASLKGKNSCQVGTNEEASDRASKFCCRYDSTLSLTVQTHSAGKIMHRQWEENICAK